MINKIKNTKYVDFTNEDWKEDFMIGMKLITRPYRKPILAAALALIIVSIIAPLDFGLGAYSGYKLLGRFG